MCSCAAPGIAFDSEVFAAIICSTASVEFRQVISRARALALAFILFGSLFALSGSALFASEPPDPLLAGFADPPNSARPRVWWHWLNGNVSQEGIRKDLEWMQRVGIGGVQNFDANFSTPQIVDKRLAYMTPQWNDAFRYGAELADKLGLEMAIATSAGWSETGGPWVQPQDGMKKLTWSETEIPEGRRFTGVLPLPPSTTGPFQDLPLADELGAVGTKAPAYYADVAVLAYRVIDQKVIPTPSIALDDGATVDAIALADRSLISGVDVPNATAEKPVVLHLTYSHAQTVRSASLFIPGSADMYAGPKISATLEASTDGRWRKVADIRPSLVPTTVSFSPVTARQFRVVLIPVPQTVTNSIGSAPGFAGLRPEMIPSPLRISIRELRLSADARINQFEAKAGFAVALDYYALDAHVNDDVKGVVAADVIDLTNRMRPDGTLDWTPPAGTWRVIRLGASLLGKTNHPASEEATGLEVDKMDGAAVRNYLRTYIGKYRDAAGAALIGPHGVNALVTDSTEVGAFNWTPHMLDQFRRLRGYDARPWLPTLTGVIVGSRAQSDQFLYDFRQTIADLHASEHYGTIAAVAHENGLKVYGEALEGWRVSLGDEMDMRRYADVPMAALWAYRREDGPRPFYLADLRGAASTSHLYGQKLVAAESLTSTRFPWAHAPSDLRRVVDLAFANGINRVVIHTSVHQPVDDRQPGLSMRHIGQFFTRHETWAEMARPWMDYIARSSYLLQQGRFVADVAYFYGEESPPGPRAQKAYFSDVPQRYAYDFVNPTAVRDILQVQDGDLVTASGGRYRLLYLGGTSERMTLRMLRRIAALAEAGATIVGDAPDGSPSLNDDGDEYASLVRQLWSGAAITPVGKGRVVKGRDVEGALRSIGVAPDFEMLRSQADTNIGFVHRRLQDGDIYFVSNRNHRPERFEARFRVTGKAPELWRADTGASAPLSYRIEGQETIVPLAFDAEDSFFVIFRSPATSTTRTVADATPIVVSALEGAWAVSFQPDRGAPATANLPALAPLNDHADPGIKYFSGIATYTKEFALPSGHRPGQSLLLDLGQVGDLAEVRVNGQMMGTVWHSPFRIDVGPALRRGKNQLEIRVANLWMNRLIGDMQPGAKKIAYTVSPMYRTDAPLRASGLIGPVQLMTHHGGKGDVNDAAD